MSGGIYSRSMKKQSNSKKSMKTGTKDRVEILLEEMKDQFSAFGEGLSLVSERQEVLIEKVDAMDKRLIRVEDEVAFIKERLIKIEERLTLVEKSNIGIDERLALVEESNARIEDEISDIKRKLSQKVDLDDLQKLEKRLVKLEKLVFARG